MHSSGDSTNTTTLGVAQAQISSLQENSLTTNVKSEPAIPTFNGQQENTDLNVLFKTPM